MLGDKDIDIFLKRLQYRQYLLLNNPFSLKTTVMPYFSNLFSHAFLPYFVRLWQALSKLKGFAWTCLGYA
jgi:hypothetical protein